MLWLLRLIGWLRGAEWSVSVGEKDGQTFIIRTRQRAPGWNLEDYPVSIELLWPYDGSESHGMPPSDVSEQMFAFEEAVATLERPGLGLQGISTTGDGRREWVWYVADANEFTRQVQAIVSDQYPVTVRTSAAP